jgi:hypothetical protein
VSALALVGAQSILYMKILGRGIAFKICVSVKRVFNTAALAHPVNECGNSRRGIVTSTPYDNFDFSLMNAVSIEEMLKVQFRAEFFNVFNIQNYGLPRTTTGRAASE